MSAASGRQVGRRSPCSLSSPSCFDLDFCRFPPPIPFPGKPLLRRRRLALPAPSRTGPMLRIGKLSSYLWGPQQVFTIELSAACGPLYSAYGFMAGIAWLAGRAGWHAGQYIRKPAERQVRP